MKKKFLIYGLLVGSLFASCEKMVEIEPKNQISPNVVFTDLNGFQAVLNSAYQRLIGFDYYGRDFQLMGDALGDNIYTAVNLSGGRYNSVNINAPGAHYNIWGTAYLIINEVNLILDKIDALSVPASKTADKARVKAQALALRALVYFDLARVYGYEPSTIPTTGPGANFNKSVVLRLKGTDDVTKATPMVRATVQEVYKSIMDDLTASINIFNTLTVSTTASSAYTLNKAAAYALRGKVQLYERKYLEAIADFDVAMTPANTQARLATNYVGAFAAATNTESLFELVITPATQMANVTGPNSSLYSYTHPTNAGPTPMSTYGGQTVSDELFALFETTDQRYAMFFKQGSPIRTWSHKYSGARAVYTDNIPVIRYADVLLMKAEAQAGLTQYLDASNTVKTLRTARSASTTGVPTDATIVSYIQDERRRELFFEGHRWFDLKRLGNGITKPAAIAGGTIPTNDHRLLAPLPTTEVQLFPALPQNPNY
ncbi:RagB/SusD family nutrient uptake outer membrane protein [Pedobacter nanyangensis]|uniref:RagB/SusD family nutrient uptake outer membrane protein n=1 Tax=Pedobacter nanyangensis TaxID=1562389 RepID=UPI000DE53DCE|nr:RagB/SusD family nutrient uptake outer membrane protein [Pedobacter nanyangensis]